MIDVIGIAAIIVVVLVLAKMFHKKVTQPVVVEDEFIPQNNRPKPIPPKNFFDFLAGIIAKVDSFFSRDDKEATISAGKALLKNGVTLVITSSGSSSSGVAKAQGVSGQGQGQST